MPRRRPQPPRSKTEATKLTRRRLAGSLSALFDIARAADVVAERGISAEDAWSVLQAGMFLRAINAVKAARLLIAELHWEFAAAPARQIFELLVTAEYIRSQADPPRSATQFTRFGFLQQMLARLEEMGYLEQTGRVVNEEVRTELRRLLEDFDDLRVGKNRDRWPRNWSGHSTARLAELSPRQPIRRHQYRQLFNAWSEQVHGSPSALLPGMFPQIEPEYNDLLEDDLKPSSEVAAMTIILFAELWVMLPAVPSPAEEQRREWSRAIFTEARGFGASMPPKPPSDQPNQRASSEDVSDQGSAEQPAG